MTHTNKAARRPDPATRFGFGKSLRTLTFGLAMIATGTANAAIVTQWEVSVDSTFDPASIVDSNGNTPGDVTISNGNRTLRWGDSDQSGLDITNSPVNTQVDTSILPNLFPPVGNVFVTHTNEPIQGTTLDKVTLQNEITLTALVPPGASQPPVTLSFLIEFQETPNNDDPCADGGALGVGVNADGCGDIFVIGADALNFSFTYDAGDGVDQEYFISFVEVTGGLQSLSTEACLSATGSADPCLGFITPESATTSFQFGTIISTERVVILPPGVPAPGALGLVALGLAALVGTRRRRTA